MVNNDPNQLRPKKPLDLIGLLVSDDVDAFNFDQAKVRFPSLAKRDSEGLLNPENGFSIDVPCIQKVFRFYTR